MPHDLCKCVHLLTDFRASVPDCPLITVFDRACSRTNLPISLIFDPSPVDNRAK